MKTSKQGIELIKHFEGCVLNAYLCPGNVWTIGYGHTKGVKNGDIITHKQSEEMLQKDLVTYENGVKSLDVLLSQNQFDVLVSFAYNLGIGALHGSTLARRLRQHNYKNIPYQLSRWVYAGGRRLSGLIRRRKAEAHLWKTGELKFYF